MKNSKIIDFYLNKIPNDEEFYLEDMWKFSFEELEDNHHYIQWMFPTDQKSNFNEKAELLTNEDIEQFISNKKLKENFIESLKIILDFYRIHFFIDSEYKYKFENIYYRFEIKYWREEENGKRKFNNFDWWNSKEIKNWITPYNHNFLRMSRILRSCRLILGQEFAESLFNFLVQYIWLQFHEIIGIETLKYWREATFELRN